MLHGDIFIVYDVNDSNFPSCYMRKSIFEWKPEGKWVISDGSFEPLIFETQIIKEKKFEHRNYINLWGYTCQERSKLFNCIGFDYFKDALGN